MIHDGIQKKKWMHTPRWNGTRSKLRNFLSTWSMGRTFTILFQTTEILKPLFQIHNPTSSKKWPNLVLFHILPSCTFYSLSLPVPLEISQVLLFQISSSCIVIFPYFLPNPYSSQFQIYRIVMNKHYIFLTNICNVRHFLPKKIQYNNSFHNNKQ